MKKSVPPNNGLLVNIEVHLHRVYFLLSHIEFTKIKFIALFDHVPWSNKEMLYGLHFRDFVRSLTFEIDFFHEEFFLCIYVEDVLDHLSVFVLGCVVKAIVLLRVFYIEVCFEVYQNALEEL
jgi:hypothetical protein